MEDVIGDAFLDGANVVEIYYVAGFILPEADANSWATNGFGTVPIAFNKPPRFVPREYRRHVQRLVEYSHKHMTYSYDTANDAQRNIVRSTIRDSIIGSFYVRALAEDIFPCHQFPCTTEIHHVSHIERTTYTIHNRLALIVDYVVEGGAGGAGGGGYYTYMLRYSHADNADRTKIISTLREALAVIKQ